MPSASSVSPTQKPARVGDGTTQVRDAIKSLKDRLGTEGAKPGETAPGDAAPVVVAPRDPKGVGTTGVWSVESRFPTTPEASSPTRGPLLSRAGDAMRRAGGITWTGIIALGVLAGGLIVALGLRRSRSAT